MSNTIKTSETLQYGVNYFGFLETVLRDLKGYRTLAHELVQNADDARGTSFLIFDVRDDALVVENDGVFADCGQVEKNECPWLRDSEKARICDFHRFRQIAGGGKRVESDTIGAFGIGFITVYQITDRPELISSGRHWIVDAENQQVKICQECHVCQEGESNGTKFILPWARNHDSLLRRRLRVEPITKGSPLCLLDELKPTIPLAMLFLNRLRKISLRHNGLDVKTYESEVDTDNDCLILSDGDESTMWHLLRGNFDDAAVKFRDRHAGRIEEKRSTNVTVAIPDEPIDEGVFCAFLPTQHKTGLPFHINADFYPTSSRKEIVLESDFQSEWNRAAVEAAAETLSSGIEKLRDSVGHQQLWRIVQAISQVGEDVEKERRDKSLGSFWGHLSSSLHQAPIVYTTAKEWVKAPGVFYLEQKDEAKAIPILESLALSVVHEDLRFAQNLLLSKAVSVPLLGADDVAEALREAGLDQRREHSQLPKFLQSDSSMQILRQEIKTLLTQYGRRRPKDQLAGAIQELSECAIAPARDGSFWPCKDVFRADDETVELFGQISPSSQFLIDLAEDDDVLSQLCPEFDAEAAISELAGLDHNDVKESASNGHFDSSQLLVWFADRKHELRSKPHLRESLRALPIYPSSAGPCPLIELSLPGDFSDPLGLADVVDLDALGGRREFLRELGAKELTFETYATDHLPRAFADESVATDKKRKAIALLARERGRIEGSETVREVLQDSAIVECQDGTFRRAAEVYFPTEAVTEVLESTASLAHIPHGEAKESVQSLYQWLGVATQPRLEDVVERIETLAAELPHNESVRALRVLFAHLGKRIEDDDAREALESLRYTQWLPAREKRDRWYQPEELFADFQRYLFESQVEFIDVPHPVQQKNTDFLRFLGIHVAPDVGHVVGHLIHCSETNVSVHTEVYPWLESRADQPEIDQLAGKACLYLSQQEKWVSPHDVFWDDNPFGRFRFQLGKEFLKFTELFERLGVRKSAGSTDALDVMDDISKEFDEGHRQLDEEAKAVLLRCWEMLERALDEDEIDDDTLRQLEDKKVICNSTGSLNPPSWMFFDDRAGLAAKFEAISSNAIERPQGAWRAMAAAGVRALSQAVKSHLVECCDPKPADTIIQLATNRSDQLARVLDFHPDGIVDNLNLLSEVQCKEVDELRIQYSLQTFKQEWSTEQENVPAHYLRGDGVLYFVRRVDQPPWPAVARELATILCPDTEPGQLASAIKDVLSAISHEKAEAMLDELGYPRLASAEGDSTITSGVVDGLGEKFDVDDFVPDDTEPPSTAGDVSDDGPASADDAIAGILGDGAAGPTPPPSELDKPEFAGSGTGGGNGGSTGGNGSSSGGTGGGAGSHTGSGTGKRGERIKRPGYARLRSYVIPSRQGAGDSDPEGQEKRSAVDKAGIARVKEYEESQQREPDVKHHTHPGYDIESSNGNGEIERYIEVKSLSGDWGDFNAGLTDTQFEKAIELKDQYWLYVVERADQDDFQIYRIQDPANKANQFLFDSGWQGVAEEEDNADNDGMGDGGEGGDE